MNWTQIIGFRIVEIKPDEVSFVFGGKNVVVTDLDLDFAEIDELIEQCSEEIITTVPLSKTLVQQAVAAFLRAE